MNYSEDALRIVEAEMPEQYYWADLWRYRELFYFLAWRDVIVRYKQTVIGMAWGLVRPLATMLAFTLIFGRVAGLPSGGVPYPLMVLAGLLPWFFFMTTFSGAAESLVANAHLFTKVYCPRMLFPATAVVVGLFDFFISGALMAIFMVWYGISPSWTILSLPFFILLMVLLAFGLGLLAAAMNVRFRDVRYVIPFVLQIALYLSPVGFGSQAIGEELRLLYSINPMVGIIDGFRWAILGPGQTLYWPAIWSSIAFSIAAVIAGLFVFRRLEKSFADIV